LIFSESWRKISREKKTFQLSTAACFCRRGKGKGRAFFVSLRMGQGKRLKEEGNLYRTFSLIAHTQRKGEGEEEERFASHSVTPEREKVHPK